jgi:hypothetical protein
MDIAVSGRDMPIAIHMLFLPILAQSLVFHPCISLPESIFWDSISTYLCAPRNDLQQMALQA